MVQQKDKARSMRRVVSKGETAYISTIADPTGQIQGKIVIKEAIAKIWKEENNLQTEIYKLKRRKNRVIEREKRTIECNQYGSKNAKDKLYSG